VTIVRQEESAPAALPLPDALKPDDDRGTAAAAVPPPLPAIPGSAVLVVVLAVLLVTFSLSAPYFLTANNLINIVYAVSVAGIIAAPGTLLLVAGQLDLSVGSGAMLTGVVMATLGVRYGIAAGVMAAVAVGLLCGALNAFAVTALRVNAIITTLGTLAIFQGAGLLITEGQSATVDGFDALGNARPLLNVPLPCFLFIGIAILFAFVMKFTRFGRQMYAIGSNRVAANLAGIRGDRLIVAGFLLSSLAFTLSGLIYVSQLGATTSNTGAGLELFVVTAIILGGASLTGGRGTITGTVLGLLILGVIGNGLVLLNVEPYWQTVVRGALLIGAVALDQVRRGRARA
jgi:ribose transport system permease protein